MNLNATLLVQIFCFLVFIWVAVRFIWPPITKALEERRQKIADGLAAAEEGRNALELAQVKSREALLVAKAEASQIVEKAHARANHIIEEAKDRARDEGARLLLLSRSEIDQAYHQAREKLMQEVVSIAIAGAEKILQREIDSSTNGRLIQNLVSEEI